MLGAAKINLMNHNVLGQRSLEDPMGIIGHQLKALGHTVIWEPKNDRFLTAQAGVNLIVEGFTPVSTDVMAQAKSNGARFVIIATEEPTPKGFNHGRDLEMVLRQAEFPNAARHCEGILYLVPGKHVHGWYSMWAPAAHVELGWAASLVRPGDVEEPQFDFGFFGSISERRMKILKELARRMRTEKTVRVEGKFPDQVTRDRVMREARVIVQIRKHEEMGLVSSSRCNTALCLGRPVIAEPHLHAKPWDEVIKFSESLEQFYSDAIMMRMAWRGVHAAQFAKFKEKFSPERCIGRALREINLSMEHGLPPVVIDATAARRSARARARRLGLA